MRTKNLTFTLYSNVCVLFSSSCGSLSTAILGPMVLGPSISIDDWVPELPPKKKQPSRPTPVQAVKRELSPDLPPPPPVVDDETFVSDEPLPPPPPEAIWPKPECLKNDKFLRNGKEKRLESSFSAVEDKLRDHHHTDMFPNYHHHNIVMSEKSKSLSYIFDSAPKAAPQTPVKSFVTEPTSNGSDCKEFGRSSSVRRNKLTIPNKDYCKSEFSARKSVFQGGSAPKQVVMSTVKPPAFSATTIQNNVVKHQICTPLKIAREKVKSPSVKSVVGPLKSSGVFPPSLEPNCPPTLYQQ